MSAAYPKCLHPNAAKVLMIVAQHHLIRLWRLHDTDRLETQGACLLIAREFINVKAAAQKIDVSVSSITASPRQRPRSIARPTLRMLCG